MDKRAHEMRKHRVDADITAGALGAPQPFRTTLEPHRETIVVAVHGEIDALTAGGLGDQLRELLDSGFKRVALDLRTVDFIDSTGLRAILDMDAKSRGTGIDFAIIDGSDQARRLFEVTGAAAALRFVDVREIDGEVR
jgi:anti-sigma B factor antagonist